MKRYVYRIAMLCLALWLFLSNIIVLCVTRSEQAVEIPFRDDWEHSSVYYSLDDVTEQRNLTEDISVRGWAFVETDQVNPARHTSCILRGEDCCYEMRIVPPEDEATYRLSFLRAEIRELFSDKKVPDCPVGIIGDFSTLRMKDGLYKLYIYCWENETTYGIADTGQWFIKSGTRMTEYDWISEPGGEKIPTVDRLCQSSVDSEKMIGNNLEIAGWAFIENMPSSQQKVYVKLINETGKYFVYTTNLWHNANIGAMYGNDQYNYSSFTARVPVDELPDGTYTLQMVVENSGYIEESLQYRNYRFQKHGDRIELWHSTQINRLSVTETELCENYVDRMNSDAEFFVVNGWAYAKEMSSSEQDVYIALEGNNGTNAIYTTLPVTRQDVGELFGDARYDKSGFTAKIPLDELQEEAYTLHVLVKNNGKVWTSAEYEFHK